jgi:hypothetical protein
LVQMTESRDNNRELPSLFTYVVGRLEEYNTPLLQEQRITFATGNTYPRQIERIEEICETHELER